MRTRPIPSFVAVAFAASALALPAGGQEPDGAGAEGPLLHGTLDLRLEDAIRMGLENNLDVQVERFGPLIAGYDATSAWGAYDPELFAEFGYRDAKTPTANSLSQGFGAPPVVNAQGLIVDQLAVTTERTTDGQAGFRGLFPILGASYEGSFGSARRTSLDSAFESLSPDYRSTFSLSASIPLLKNLIWNQPWTQVRTSRILLASSEDDFRRAVMDVVQQIEDAYWTLIAAQEARRVAEKSLVTAQALLDQTKTQYEVGVISKVEVTEAEAGLSARQVSLIRAENQYLNQQDVVIDRVLGPNLRADSSLEINPTDRPEDFVPYDVDVVAAVGVAFESRPELAAAQKEVERNRVQLSFAKNQQLPQLDAQVGYSFQGLSGEDSGNSVTGPTGPSTGLGGYSDSFDDYFDQDLGRTWSARGILSIPLPNTTARSNASKTKLELRRAGTRQRQLEQQIIIEVRKAARNLRASQEAIVAAENARRAAAEQLRAEEIRLEYGESTPFEVLQREESLVDRERETIEAYQAYRTSVTALDRAQGTILRNNNIRIAEVAPLR